MSVFGDEEYTLTDIVEYVNKVAMQLEGQGLPAAQVQQIIDGYGQFVFDEWIEGTSSKQLAQEFFKMYQTRVPMQKPTRSLFKLSRYVSFIVIDLVNFGFDLEDALIIVDDFDEAVVGWFPMVEPRVAARRLGVMNRRLAAGIALHEG